MTEYNVPFFDLRAQLADYSGELHEALDAVLGSGGLIGGKSVDAFEAEFAQKFGIQHAVTVGNGLDAIRLILEGYGVGPEDQVIVPNFTFYATWLAVMQVGAIPVGVDVELESGNIDAALVEDAITSKTRAIIAVHLFGRPARMRELQVLAKKHKLILIEDAAQAHGAMVDDRYVGNLGDAAAFSFYPTKNLGALGDGGAVTTQSSRLADLLRSLRSYGVGETKYEHVNVGWNTRLDSLQAEFLSLHLKKLGGFTERRREIAGRYLSEVPELRRYALAPEKVADSVWHHFVLKSENRASSRNYLESRGIRTDIHYPYVLPELKPVVAYLKEHHISIGSGNFERAAKLSTSVFSLPIGPWMTDEQVDTVIAALREEGFIETLSKRQ